MHMHTLSIDHAHTALVCYNFIYLWDSLLWIHVYVCVCHNPIAETMSESMYVPLYFPEALSSQSGRTDKNPSQNCKRLSQDCCLSHPVSSTFCNKCCLLSCGLFFSAIYFVFWQIILTLLHIKSTHVAMLGLLHRRKGNTLDWMFKIYPGSSCLLGNDRTVGG